MPDLCTSDQSRQPSFFSGSILVLRLAMASITHRIYTPRSKPMRVVGSCKPIVPHVLQLFYYPLRGTLSSTRIAPWCSLLLSSSVWNRS